MNGFGSLEGNLWLGLDKIARLTSNGPAQLHVYLEDINSTSFAKYSAFQVSDSTDNYRLLAEGYSGSAVDGLAFHNGSIFQTFDMNNSGCATLWRSGWWYNNCYHSHLNGAYGTTGCIAIMWHDDNFSCFSALAKTLTIMKLKLHD